MAPGQNVPGIQPVILLSLSAAALALTGLAVWVIRDSIRKENAYFDLLKEAEL